MTTPTSEPPDLTTSNADLNRYLAATAGGQDGEGLLGHLVIYNVTDVEQCGETELREWFTELGLDVGFLPGPPRQDAAFEKATSAAKARYAPDGHRGRAHASQGRTVTLMMRNVARDEARVVRHLVRELADHGDEALSYEVRVATAEFVRATDPSLPEGSGTMTLATDQDTVDTFDPAERDTINELIMRVAEDYRTRSQYVSADRLRKMLRDYVERVLAAVRIHPGVYFVHRRHAAALADLRTLAARFGAELTRVPLADATETRSMVDGAFAAKAQADLESLARDIARVQADGPKPYQVRLLHQRYTAVKQAAEQYQADLDTHLTTTDATLGLIQAQMATLMISAADTETTPADQLQEQP
ncbi:hypothetical protein Ga0074812_1485 [Parafrankia irregularis]|uniref:Uncharacterized protein n=1 Tax=Parafrankia irregularis TaxID=795642 RepID=A0A0S4QYZ5_9ACTN|nr:MULTISPECIES: DUF6744 family protein [Parafrankia]MBE3206785.1 hypothetical protein [Parafrankia sp. CH37]CUU60805.1 hypothetical protein Ga0074812_1485 [Parafrankia irregularis]